uniref:PIN domain-containing protein n=1 Tax=Candidatus Kentrum sp. MB TaxID=2138164 RepID=A0A450XQ16_9GAMM|nr:MAG: hypothetical protein BECKMB1821G_GA0114241_10817 [Candidatus Kentron sp. MB]
MRQAPGSNRLDKNTDRLPYHDAARFFHRIPFLHIMETLRIYVDTSVIGGCFDREFQEWSEALTDHFRRGRYLAVVSDVVTKEIEGAPDFVKKRYQELLSIPAEIIDVSEEAVSLVGHYMARGILTQRFLNDAMHIALATIAKIDMLVGWNFKHIVRLDKIRLFNTVNMAQGYKPLTIYSPREVVHHDQE